MRDLNTLTEPLQNRLRCLHHTTSVDVAVQMLDSKCIWSNDLDRSANFSHNTNCVDRLDNPSEVVLIFRYSGSALLVPFDYPEADYLKDTLYIYVVNGLFNQNLENLKVWAARWPAGSSIGMTCVGFKIHTEFVEDLKTNTSKQAMVNCLIRLIGSGVEMNVPSLDFIRSTQISSQALAATKICSADQNAFQKGPLLLSDSLFYPKSNHKIYQSMMGMVDDDSREV